MSWGVQAHGKVTGVRKLLRDNMAKATPCPEIEERIRQLAGNLLDATLATYSPDTYVKVDCRGSLCMADWPSEKGVTQHIIVVVEPLHDFVDEQGAKHG
jgi:hypothetical protein